MSVVSEDGIRKIIRSRLTKEGFMRDARSNSGEGSVDYLECDLSALKNSQIAKTIAKYIFIKPVIEKTAPPVDPETGAPTVSVYDKNMLFAMLSGGLGAEQSAQYDREAEQYLAKYPDVIGNWVDLLQFSITQVFGPLSKMYCKLFTTLFLTGRPQDTRDLERESSAAPVAEADEIAKKILKAFRIAGDRFAFKQKILVSRQGFESEHLILFPNTFIALEASEVDDAKANYDDERKKIREAFFINRIEIRKLPGFFRDYLVNISDKSEIIQPIDDLANSLQDNRENNDLLNSVLVKIAQECESRLLSKYNLS